MTIDDAGDSNFTQAQGNMSAENEAFVQCPEGSENAIFCAYLNSTVWEEVRLTVSRTQRKQISLTL